MALNRSVESVHQPVSRDTVADLVRRCACNHLTVGSFRLACAGSSASRLLLALALVLRPVAALAQRTHCRRAAPCRTNYEEQRRRPKGLRCYSCTPIPNCVASRTPGRGRRRAPARAAMSNASAWQEARLAAVLAELDEASARAEALGEEADELQRRLADGRAGEELTDNERFESGSESDSESEEPELPKRLDEQDGDEEGAPVLPYFSDADRALEAQLSAELGVDVSALCDRVVAHIRPTEHWLCFDARAYVRTLAAAVLRSRRVRDNGFVYPPEMDNLVCGGVTQARPALAHPVAPAAADAQPRWARPCSSSSRSSSPTSSVCPAWCAPACARPPSVLRQLRLRSRALRRCRSSPPRCKGASTC